MRLLRLFREHRRAASASAARTAGRMMVRRGRPDIVFLGDSITEFWPEADPWMFWRGRVNLGASGYSSGQMLERFEREVIALAPRVVHVMGGTNDLWYGAPGPEAASTLENLVEIAARAKALGMGVVLASTPPISSDAKQQFAYPELLPILQSAIRRYCLSAGLVHADYARLLADEEGTIRPQFTSDGVHLSRAGYAAMRDHAERALRAALRTSRSS